MMHSWGSLRSFNKISFALAFLFASAPVISHAQFRSKSDRAVVKDVLGLFGRECGLRVASEDDVIRRLEEVSATARRSTNEGVTKCYQVHYSQIIGVAQLYQRLCRDVSTKTEKVDDHDLAEQLVRVSRYQSSIRPYHSVLNDCLMGVANREGLPFVVPLVGAELRVEFLQRELEHIKPVEPFNATAEPFR